LRWNLIQKTHPKSLSWKERDFKEPLLSPREGDFPEWMLSARDEFLLKPYHLF